MPVPSANARARGGAGAGAPSAAGGGLSVLRSVFTEPRASPGTCRARKDAQGACGVEEEQIGGARGQHARPQTTWRRPEEAMGRLGGIPEGNCVHGKIAVAIVD